MRKMVATHLIMKKVEVKLHSIVFILQFNKLGVNHPPHINRERLGGEHQHADKYVITSFNVGTCI
jgi:hypothetical protein